MKQPPRPTRTPIALRHGVAIALAAGLALGGGCVKVCSIGDLIPPAIQPSPSKPKQAKTDDAFTQREAKPTPRDVGRDGSRIQWTSDAKADAQPRGVNVFGEMESATFVADTAAGVMQHTFPDEGYDADVAVDPTGKWLAFASTRYADHPDIFLQAVDGQAVTQLTSDPANHAHPAFSPDGKRLAFSSTQSGGWQIHMIDVDGGNPRQVTSGPLQAVHPSFSPDGKRLCYMALDPKSNQWEIWTLDLTTREKSRACDGLFPTWSPDKSRDVIAFQRPRQRGMRSFSIWTMEVSGGQARRMTEVAGGANAAVVSPAWSPDGKKLAFATVAENSKTASGGRPHGKSKNAAKPQQDIWTLTLDSGEKRRLTDGRGADLQPFWAADGRIYFISDRGGKEAVWSAAAPSEQGAMRMAAKSKGDGAGEGSEPKVDPFAATDAGDAAP